MDMIHIVYCFFMALAAAMVTMLSIELTKANKRERALLKLIVEISETCIEHLERDHESEDDEDDD